MANTLLRIGYISGSGGGGGISQYPDLASFPPTGSVTVLYFAIDTAKLYAWDGVTYIEASPSFVTSVNTQVGDVVLDKSDLGLGNVDNTSDADKPISDATQTALDLITDVTWTGDYNNGVTYTVGQGVMYNGASFRMIAAIGAAGYNPAGYPGNWLQVTDYVSANDIGLGNVDNTSDADKPISDDTQDALDLKVAKAGDTMSGLLDITVTGAVAIEANDIVIGNPWGAGYSVITPKDGSTDQMYVQSADQLGTFAGNDSKQMVITSGYTSGANSGAVQIVSGDAQVSGNTGSVSVSSSQAVTGNSGNAQINSGSVSTQGNSGIVAASTGSILAGSGASGNAQINSGSIGATATGASGIATLFSGSLINASSTATTGNIVVRSGDQAGLGASGAARMRSGPITNSSSSADTGIADFFSGDNAGAGKTGNVSVFTGNNTGTGPSGDVVLSTGTTASGTRGAVTITSRIVEINSQLDMQANKIIDMADGVNPTDAVNKGQLDAGFDASIYYHELHVNYDFTGATSDGSPYKPFKTTQAAVNAAQLQNIGGNTAILIHLKNDITMVENITVSNAVSNLYIMPAVRNNTSSAPFKIIGSLTISGSQTNRVRVQDIEFGPTSGYALVINDTPGRHLFENCGFVNGSVAGLAGTGVNLTSTYRNFIEFVDCTIEGTLNIAGTPVAGTSVLMYRCKLSYANVIVNSANIAVGIYDTYGIYGLTHTAGALALTGLWGITQSGFFNSTATLTATNVLSLSNVSLQKPDLSFVALNKTGTCFYQLMNVHRGETADVLTGTRVVYGPTATDAGYKMGTSGNWPAVVSNVAGALDSLAANKIAVTQKGAVNGVASLDGTGKVPSAQLPSYVDDVLEFANLAAFPVTGTAGIIYIAIDTNRCYRWSGSAYIEVSPAPVTSVNGKTNAVTLNAIDIPFTPTATILSTDVQAAIEEVEASSAASTAAIFEDTKEPTGFINRTDSTTSFVDGSRIFTIAPVSTSFSFYIKGEKFTKTTSQQITIPNFAGNHYIYFNTSGVLESTQIFSSDIIEQNAFVSVIYWNTDLNTHTYFAEERHGITMDGATHIYLHTTFGARYLSGLALQGFTPNGNGSLDAHAQFTADEGSIRDEDILLSSAAQAQIPILFRQGQLWRKKAADAFPLIYSGTAGYTGANGRIPYNQFVAGSWQLTQVTSGDYVLVHFFATNDKENPIVGIQGIAQYNNAPQARAAASTEITSLSGLPFAEFVAIGTVLFQTNTYANTPDARVVSVNGATYIDFRGTQLYTPAGEATEHSLLSGLADDDHIQYHTDARGDIRYYTKAQVDTLITGITSPGDIDEKLFSISNSQALPDNVHNFVFSNSVTRSFEALVSVEINATASLFETVRVSGIQKGSDWDITIVSTGDVSGVSLSITSSGQIQYTSQNIAGFVSGIIKFRAITTSV